MVKIYTHDGITKRHIGTCKNGKVYREEAIGETEIGSYENGDVYSGTGWTKKRVGGYDSKTIYKSGFFDDAIGEVDASGDAYDGTDLFKNITGRKIRDVGAAAAAQLLFPGCYYEEEGAADVSTASSASSDSGDNDVSFLFVLFAGIGMALLGIVKLLWKGIKTLPFWGPYGFSVLLPLLMVLIMMPSTAVVMIPAVGAIVGFSLPVYLVLHTVLLIKCKKRQDKGKYWPIYISFALFALGFTIALCVPAVIYQIVWLVRDKKKQTGGAE